MATAYIGLGSNLGNCRRNLLQAWARLGDFNGVKLLVLSNPYRSAPVGMESKNWFINAAGSLQTSLPPEELLAVMLAVEADLGRQRDHDSGPQDRTVDLDLLYWGDMVSGSSRLILPHPEIVNRLFVLLPLAEIAPKLCHPVSQKTSAEMLHNYMAKHQGADIFPQVYKTSWSQTDDEVLT